MSFPLNFILKHIVHLVVHFVGQFFAALSISYRSFIGGQGEKILIVTYYKYAIKNICSSYLYFRMFFLFKNQWNVDKDKIYMNMKRKFFGRKGELCSHQRRIQNVVKHFRWKRLLNK